MAERYFFYLKVLGGLIGFFVLIALVVWFVFERPPRAGTIFISYRRADSRDVTGRIYDHLKKVFRGKAIFIDVWDIPAGRDFRAVLEERLAKCKIALVVIGDQWLTLEDESGQRRLDDPDDYVRMEVARVLSGGVIVLPCLVQGAQMPKAEELPEGLKQLAYQQGIPIRPDPDFNRDVNVLAREIKNLIRQFK